MSDAVSLTKVKILIVEDDRMIAVVLRDMLHVMGFRNVHFAKDGANAISELKKEEYDLVITDWKMKPMDGLELTKFIRASDQSPNKFVPVIMISGYAEIEQVFKARDTGITEYLVKPFSAATLFERIKAVVDKPRQFILAKHYKGPDRRRRDLTPPPGGLDRRKKRKN